MSFYSTDHPVLVGHCSVCKVPMMSKTRWGHLGRAAAARRYPGYSYHGGHGYCAAHHARWARAGSPTEAPKRKRSTRTCTAEGCSRPHQARGLCNTHYKAAWDRGELGPTTKSPGLKADEVLDDWAMIRDAGETDLRRAADRIGMTFAALEKALWRARKRGDLRGSLEPYAHDMRRNAA